ncbi:BTAD domain-containing putative transcriptional regulator [Paenibacillus sp. CAU 1782]
MKSLETKLRMPSLHNGILRERLVAAFNHGTPMSFIHVSAPDGYGKTTAVSGFLEMEKKSPVWYAFDDGDHSALQILHELSQGIGYRLGRPDWSGAGAKSSPDDALAEMAAGLSHISEQFVIVLDNFDQAEGDLQLRGLIQKLVAFASRFVSFIFIGTLCLHGDWAKLKSSRNYLELTAADLAFNSLETAEYFRRVCGMELLPGELENVMEKTEGWPAAYPFVAKSIQGKDNDERMVCWAISPFYPPIFHYFSSVVMARHEEEMILFLQCSSLLTRLDAAILNPYLGIEDSAERVAALTRYNLFVVEDNGALRYHALFRTYLYNAYGKRIGEEGLKKQHLKLGAIYEKQFQYFHAFAHHIAGSDFLGAARCINAVSSRYNGIELMSLADGWVEKVSPHLSMAYTTFFLFRCYSKGIRRDLITYMEERLAQLTGPERVVARMLAEHRLAAFYMCFDVNKAIERYQSSLEQSVILNDYAVTAFNLSGLADIYRCQGLTKKAMSFARRALYVAETHGIKPIQMLVLDTLSNIFLDEGQVDKGELFARQALELSQGEADSSRVFILSTFCRIYRMQGDYEQSVDWARKACRLADEFSLHIDRGWATFELAQTIDAKGEGAEGERLFAQSCRWVAGAPEIAGYFDKMWRSRKGTGQGDVGGKALIAEKTPKLQLRVLGKFSVSWGEEPIVIHRASSLRIFQYLITHRDVKVSKDVLIGHLFPEMAGGAATNHFHVALSTLRKSLDRAEDYGLRILTRQTGLYHLDFTHIDMDLDGFYASLPSPSQKPESLAALLRAEALYRGDYFAEFPYEPFLEIEREKIRRIYLNVLRTLAQAYHQQGQHGEAFAYYDKLIAQDLYQEDAYVEYIGVLQSLGMGAHAKAIASKMERYIAKELGLALPMEVAALLRR